MMQSKYSNAASDQGVSLKARQVLIHCIWICITAMGAGITLGPQAVHTQFVRRQHILGRIRPIACSNMATSHLLVRERRLVLDDGTWLTSKGHTHLTGGLGAPERPQVITL